MPRPGLESGTLKRVLDDELAAGNAVVAVETAWSAMDRVVRMERPLSDASIESALQNDAGCKPCGTGDPHYGPPSRGVMCGREAITGPAGR